jgi:ectoine hydroxylase-related dioxygenase (phytanoyl-CoA dioxygenase family)
MNDERRPDRTKGAEAVIDSDLVSRYQQDGYAVIPGLFSPEEAAMYRDHYMALRAKGGYPGDFSGVNADESDPLKRFPRMIHMHRWDEVSLRWMVDARIRAWLTALMGREPFAVQTMLYFKPPGARGQAVHQDQFYLKVRPGTCAAAWMALDRCDEENGCLLVVPGTQGLPVLCTGRADTAQSFTEVEVPLPEGVRPVPVVMAPGDALFFEGHVIHGSLPNRSGDRFRRALIGHYIAGEAEQVAKFYHPVLRMDGTEVPLQVSEGGGPCGVWVEKGGEQVVEMRG